jgi:hypothetical protein
VLVEFQVSPAGKWSLSQVLVHIGKFGSCLTPNALGPCSRRQATSNRSTLLAESSIDPDKDLSTLSHFPEVMYLAIDAACMRVCSQLPSEPSSHSTVCQLPVDAHNELLAFEILPRDGHPVHRPVESEAFVHGASSVQHEATSSKWTRTSDVSVWPSPAATLLVSNQWQRVRTAHASSTKPLSAALSLGQPLSSMAATWRRRSLSGSAVSASTSAADGARVHEPAVMGSACQSETQKPLESAVGDAVVDSKACPARLHGGDLVGSRSFQSRQTKGSVTACSMHATGSECTGIDMHASNGTFGRQAGAGTRGGAEEHSTEKAALVNAPHEPGEQGFESAFKSPDSSIHDTSGHPSGAHGSTAAHENGWSQCNVQTGATLDVPCGEEAEDSRVRSALPNHPQAALGAQPLPLMDAAFCIAHGKFRCVSGGVEVRVSELLWHAVAYDASVGASLSVRGETGVTASRVMLDIDLDRTQPGFALIAAAVSGLQVNKARTAGDAPRASEPASPTMTAGCAVPASMPPKLSICCSSAACSSGKTPSTSCAISWLQSWSASASASKGLIVRLRYTPVPALRDMTPTSVIAPNRKPPSPFQLQQDVNEAFIRIGPCTASILCTMPERTMAAPSSAPQRVPSAPLLQKLLSLGGQGPAKPPVVSVGLPSLLPVEPRQTSAQSFGAFEEATCGLPNASSPQLSQDPRHDLLEGGRVAQLATTSSLHDLRDNRQDGALLYVA